MFSANSGTGLNHYRSVGVESLTATAAPHQLVVMLFDGARAAVAVAKGHLARRETAAKGAAISKAIAIIDGGLKASLDLKVGAELATNLSDLYAYMGQRLLYANLKNDAAALDEVATLLEQLGDAWRAIAAKPAAAATAAIAPAPPAQANRAAAAQVPAQRPAAAGPAQAHGAAADAPSAVPVPTAASQSVQSRRLAAAYGSR